MCLSQSASKVRGRFFRRFKSWQWTNTDSRTVCITDTASRSITYPIGVHIKHLCIGDTTHYLSMTETRSPKCENEGECFAFPTGFSSQIQLFYNHQAWNDVLWFWLLYHNNIYSKVKWTRNKVRSDGRAISKTRIWLTGGSDPCHHQPPLERFQ